jgi:Leucine-rich repeat (LRR) protein
MGKFKGKNPERLSSISHVEYLYLSRYTGFSFSLLRGFSRLRFLELDYTSISDLSGIENASALRVLELTECRKLADIGAISNVSKLRGLRMALCNRIRDYSPLECLTNLQFLAIEANQLPSLLFLEKLRSLQVVALPVGRLEDNRVPDLSSLTALREVSIPKKKWSVPLVDKLRSQLPNCEVEVF